MNRFIRFSSFFSFFLLVACSSTGVVPTGAGSYMLAKTGAAPGATGAEVTADLYREANEFCAKQNRQFVNISVDAKDWKPFVRLANSKLEFKCDEKSTGNERQ